MIHSPSIVAGLYGLCVIASGVWRYVGSEGGDKGLWFGIVMGSVALISAIMFFSNRDGLGNLLIWIAILTVGAWFVYETLFVRGLAAAEPRMLAIILLTIATAAWFLVWQLRGRDPDWKMFVE